MDGLSFFGLLTFSVYLALLACMLFFSCAIWGQFNKTFTSEIYKCSYCFWTLKRWQVYLNWPQVLFLVKGEKRTPDTFTSRVVCCPLIKASVIVCFVMSDSTGNSSGWQQRWLIYIPAFQASGECQVDTVVANENITDFKDWFSTAVSANLALSLPCGTCIQTALPHQFSRFFSLHCWLDLLKTYCFKTKLNLSLLLIEFLNHLVAFDMKRSGLSLRFQVACINQSINQHIYFTMLTTQ